MLTIQFASNPKYGCENNERIELLVKFAEFTEVMPFTACHVDSTNYGPELFNNAIMGLYGPIESYVSPKVNSSTMASGKIIPPPLSVIAVCEERRLGLSIILY